MDAGIKLGEPWSPKRAKEESEDKVLELLSKKSPMRWSELLDLIKLSSRTLKKALDRLIEKGKVYREQSSGEEYPLPVLYGLTDIGRGEVGPYIFGSRIHKFVYGSIEPPTNSSDEVLTWKSPYENMNDGEILANLGKRVGLAFIFAMLKSQEMEKYAWIERTLHELSNEFYFILALVDKTPQFLATMGFSPTQPILDYNAVGFNEFKIPAMSKERITHLLEKLNELFPDEIDELKEYWEKVRSMKPI